MRRLSRPHVCVASAGCMLAVVALWTIASAEESADAGEIEDLVALRFGLAEEAMLKLKVRELKEMLRRKGASCDACVSKRDLVDRIAEVKGWEDVQEEVKPKVDEPEMDDKQKEVMRNLEEALKQGKQGGSGIKVMNADGTMREVENIEEFVKEQRTKENSGKDDL